ncbi:MAG: hypothetical protein R2707_13215 [Acidimicrobiales bacterium]
MTTSGGAAGLRLRPRRIMLFAGFVAGLLIVAFGADLGLRWITTPWDVSIGGRSTLTGTWSGDVALPDDAIAQTSITLSRSPDEDGPNLEGSATICLGTQVTAYTVTGDADRNGTIDDLRLRPETEELPWIPVGVSTTWTGDELTMRGAWQATGPTESDEDGLHAFSASLTKGQPTQPPCVP